MSHPFRKFPVKLALGDCFPRAAHVETISGTIDCAIDQRTNVVVPETSPVDETHRFHGPLAATASFRCEYRRIEIQVVPLKSVRFVNMARGADTSRMSGQRRDRALKSSRIVPLCSETAQSR